MSMLALGAGCGAATGWGAGAAVCMGLGAEACPAAASRRLSRSSLENVFCGAAAGAAGLASLSKSSIWLDVSDCGAVPAEASNSSRSGTSWFAATGAAAAAAGALKSFSNASTAGSVFSGEATSSSRSEGCGGISSEFSRLSTSPMPGMLSCSLGSMWWSVCVEGAEKSSATSAGSS